MNSSDGDDSECCFDADADLFFGPIEGLDDIEPEKPARSQQRKSNDSDEGFNDCSASISLRQRRISRAIPKLQLAPVLSHKLAVRTPKEMWKIALSKIKVMNLKDPWEDFKIDNVPPEFAIRHRYSPTRRRWVTDKVEVRIEKKMFSRGALRQCFRLKKLSNFSRSRDWKKSTNYVAKKYIEPVDRDVYFQDVCLQMDAKFWGEEYNRYNPPKKVDIFQVAILEFTEREGKPLFHLEHFIEGQYVKYNSNSGFVDETYRKTPQAFSHFTFERSGHQLMVVDIQGCGDLYTDPAIHTAEGTLYGDGNLGCKGMALFFHSHTCNIICKSLGLSVFDLAPNERRLQQTFMKRINSNEKSYARTRVKSEEGVSTVSSLSGCEMPFELRPRHYSGTSSQDEASHSHSGSMEHVNLDAPLFSPRHVTHSLSSHQVNFSSSLHFVPQTLGSSATLRGTRRRSHSEAAHIHRRGVASEPEQNGHEPDGPDYGTSFNDDDFMPNCHNGHPSALFGTSPGGDSSCGWASARRRRFTSGASQDDSALSEDDGEHRPQPIIAPNQKSRPSCKHDELAEYRMREETRLTASILGQVHHEMAKYHEIGRFNQMDLDLNSPQADEGIHVSPGVEEEPLGDGMIRPDWEAALFHERIAAELGVLEAILSLARLYLDLPRDVLVNFPVDTIEDCLKEDTGVDYMLQAAKAGDRAAMVYMARAFDSGSNLGRRAKDWSEAVYWYAQALAQQLEDDSGCFDCTLDDPPYVLLARQAELYAEGDDTLAKDCNKAAELYSEAAEAATSAMKGRLANRYYIRAEELWAEGSGDEGAETGD